MPSDERENILNDEAQIISLETHFLINLNSLFKSHSNQNFSFKSECFSRPKS